MHGYGKYTFTSGAVYSGQWLNGQMSGKGKMVNADGTSYEGDWLNNVMNGEGVYFDIDKVTWEGIFINGSYESKIQKKLRVEKEVENKVHEYQDKSKTFFTDFMQAHSKSDKKTYRDNLSPFFASADTCIDYVHEPYCKYEERSPDQWNEFIKEAYSDG